MCSVTLSACVAAASIGAAACRAAGYPTHEASAVLQPLSGEIDAMMGALGGGRVVDGPTRVHCHPYPGDDPSIAWRVFARSPLTASTPLFVERVLQARRSAGWIVEATPPAREISYRFSKDGTHVRLSYLPSGAGDVVMTGESECFLPSPGG